ncbi:MAG: hypothetical protein GXP28_10690 [Planctomycetes bacterium]|nr:hypothetical protein [Planctomycetota bacterium]
MFRFFLSVLLGTLSLEAGQAREPQFPYVAYVIEAEAYVRSGPGQKYYPTQQLAQGFAVEVYRHDGEGRSDPPREVLAGSLPIKFVSQVRWSARWQPREW